MKNPGKTPNEPIEPIISGISECDSPPPRVFELPEDNPFAVTGKKDETRGAPTLYREEFARVARTMCRMGATDMNLADAFGVTQRTIDNWRINYPDFRIAMKVGKHVADNLVERSLFQRAVGFEVEDVKVFMPAGAKTPVAVPVRVRIPGDVKAQSLWLMNRKPDKWREELKVQTAVSVTIKQYQIPGSPPMVDVAPLVGETTHLVEHQVEPGADS